MSTRFSFLTVVLIIVAMNWSSVQAAPIATSTFDINDEGWGVVTTLGYVGTPNWSATGGNPDGFIYATDPDTGAWGFRAPGKFLGDVSTCYGQLFSFDLATDSPVNDTCWVGLLGGGIELVIDFPAPTSAYPAWFHQDISMIETAGWLKKLIDDTWVPATQADMLTTLSNLSELVITAECADGDDMGGLDNVVLVPEPATFSLLALGGLVVMRRRRK